jgi:hypothetical protein
VTGLRETGGPPLFPVLAPLHFRFGRAMFSIWPRLRPTLPLSRLDRRARGVGSGVIFA